MLRFQLCGSSSLSVFLRISNFRSNIVACFNISKSANIMTTQSIWLHELLNIPAMAAPTGTHPNFVNPSNLRVEADITLAICMTISMMAVGMRMWTQIRLVHKVFLDDCSSFSHRWSALMTDCCRDLLFGAGMILPLLSIQANEQMMFFVFCGMAIVVTKCPFGVHQWNLKLKDLSGSLYVWFWFTHLRWNWQDVQWSRYAIIIYPFALFFIKLAILLQCLRVFVPMNLRNATFWICHGLIWLNFLFYSSIVFVAIFPCRPLHKFWNPWINGHCFHHLATFTTVTAAVNTASHFSILVLLQYVIWNLQMSLKKKLRISTIFLIGIL